MIQKEPLEACQPPAESPCLGALSLREDHTRRDVQAIQEAKCSRLPHLPQSLEEVSCLAWDSMSRGKHPEQEVDLTHKAELMIGLWLVGQNHATNGRDEEEGLEKGIAVAVGDVVLKPSKTCPVVKAEVKLLKPVARLSLDLNVMVSHG